MQKKSFLAFGRPLHKSVAEVVGKTKSLVLHGKNRSFKRQNTISLKTGISIKVSEMLRLHLIYLFFLPGKALSGSTRRQVAELNELYSSPKRQRKH